MPPSEDVKVPGRGRTLDAFLAEPAPGKSRRAGVLVVHEIFGLDDHIRDVCRRFAEEGYVALGPNLFSGDLAELMTPANVRLALEALAHAPSDLRSNPEKFREFAWSQPPERRPILEAFATANHPLTQEGYAADLRGAAEWLRARSDVDPGRVGAVGFCFGGGMVARLATVDPKLRAAVIFYGRNPALERVPDIRASVLGLYASEDPGITQTVPAFAEAMSRAGKKFDHHVYDGARHAFFNDRRPNYHAPSATDAWRRVLTFFERELSSSSPPSSSRGYS